MLLERVHSQPWDSWLASHFPAHKLSPRVTDELWLCGLDGRLMRQIGELEVTAKTRPKDLRWRPDGKSVSYLYRNALYVAPVN